MHIVVDRVVDLLSHLRYGSSSVQSDEKIALLVVIKDRSCLRVVLEHSLVKSLGSIILALDQWFASDIIRAFNLGWVVDDMVASSACGMDSPSLDALHKNTLVDVELEYPINVHFDFLEHLIEFLSLCSGPGETVKKDTSCAFRVFQVV